MGRRKEIVTTAKNERFSVRIKQIATGAWRVANYATTLEGAKEIEKDLQDNGWETAIFEGSKKVSK